MHFPSFVKDKKSFIINHILDIIIIAFLSILSNKYNSSILAFVSFLISSFFILSSKKEDVTYWSFFFIPSIRLLDASGVSYLVNILIVLPLIKFLRFFTLPKLINLSTLMVFITMSISFFNLIRFGLFTEIIPHLAWCLGLVLCVLSSKQLSLNSGEIFDSLSLGIIFSSITLVLGHSSDIDILNEYNNYRFLAYADDPNYFSLYILISMSVWIIIDKNIYRLVSIIGLFIIGLYTGSKMQMVVSAFIVLLIAAKLFKNIKSTREIKSTGLIVVSSIMMCFLYMDKLSLFLTRFIDRLGGLDASIDTMTTGRYHLVLYYLYLLSSNLDVFLLGNGFRYGLVSKEVTSRIAHNTFVDLFMCWGSIFIYSIYILLV